MQTEDATIDATPETTEAPPKRGRPRKVRSDEFGVTEVEPGRDQQNDQQNDQPRPMSTEAPAEPFVEPYDPTEPNAEVIDDEVAALKHRLDAADRWRSEVNDLSRRVSDADRVVERISRNLKDAKKDREDLVAKLTEVSGTPPPSDEDDAAKYPLLYPAKDGSPSSVHIEFGNSETVFRHVYPAPTDAEAWRAEPLTVLGLSDRILEELHAANLATVGQLADYTTPNSVGYCRALTDISGIGEAKAEKIADAMEAFWASRPAPAVVPFALETEGVADV